MLPLSSTRTAQKKAKAVLLLRFTLVSSILESLATVQNSLFENFHQFLNFYKGKNTTEQEKCLSENGTNK